MFVTVSAIFRPRQPKNEDTHFSVFSFRLKVRTRTAGQSINVAKGAIIRF
jgi:hypothetical protein